MTDSEFFDNVQNSPETSEWLKQAMMRLSDRDAFDALDDVRVLMRWAIWRATTARADKRPIGGPAFESFFPKP